MNAAWHSLLAENDSPLGFLRWLIPVILGALVLLQRLFKKAKQWAEQEEARRQEQLGRGPSAAERARLRQEVAARQAMSALREILGIEPEIEEPPPRPAPPPVLRPVAGIPGAQKRPPAPRLRRAPGPARAAGQGVRREVERLEKGLAVEELQRRQRLQELEHLRTSIATAAGGPEAERQIRVRVDLSDRTEAVKAILYSEILGSPKALRRGPESWER
ncbi:MAG: hypothetical protein AMJ81_02660 [Phycisphaerae bacterium SM23_33]|nr:MAG: hypothetical protein AMJ81_02660 [Phycisphaerae bacterium SM23_33]